MKNPGNSIQHLSAPSVPRPEPRSGPQDGVLEDRTVPPSGSRLISGHHMAKLGSHTLLGLPLPDLCPHCTASQHSFTPQLSYVGGRHQPSATSISTWFSHAHMLCSLSLHCSPTLSSHQGLLLHLPAHSSQPTPPFTPQVRQAVSGRCTLAPTRPWWGWAEAGGGPGPGGMGEDDSRRSAMGDGTH